MPRSLPLFRQPLSAALLTALAACAGAGDARNTVTVDTLPGGIPRVMSSSPLQPGRWSLVALHDVQPPAGDTAELLNPQSIALAADGSLAVGEQTPAHV